MNNVFVLFAVTKSGGDGVDILGVYLSYDAAQNAARAVASADNSQYEIDDLRVRATLMGR